MVCSVVFFKPFNLHRIRKYCSLTLTLVFLLFSLLYIPVVQSGTQATFQTSQNIDLSLHPDLNTVLTDSEKQWIRDHPRIQIGVDGNWPPIDFFDSESGIHVGIAAEYIELLEERLNIKFEVVARPSFNQMLKEVIKGSIHIGSTISYSDERANDLLFSKPFISLEKVIFASRNYQNVKGANNLVGKTVAVENGFLTMKDLQDLYPGINLLPFDSTLQALQAVSWGEADFYIGNQAVASWLIRENQLSNLRIISSSSLPKGPQNFAISKSLTDWHPLVDIINKGIDSISFEERKEIELKWILMGISGQRHNQSVVDLTRDEQQWLIDNPVVRVANEEDWPPFDYASRGVALGYSINLMKLVAEKTGLKVEFINGYSWDKLMAMGKNREIDVFPAIWLIPGREKYLSFSTPYAYIPDVLVARENSNIRDVNDLNGRVVAGTKSSAAIIMLKKLYPGIRVLETQSTHEGLRAVTFGQADAFIDGLDPIQYLIKHLNIQGLSILGDPTSGVVLDGTELRLAARNDQPHLISILQKGLDAISVEEKTALAETWLSTEKNIEKTVPPVTQSIEIWWLISAVFIVFFLLLIIVKILPRVFTQEYLDRGFNSKNFKSLLLLTMSIFVILVAALITITLAQNKAQLIEQIEVNLGVTLKNTVERLDTWSSDRKRLLSKLGASQELFELSERLLYSNNFDVLADNKPHPRLFKEIKDVLSRGESNLIDGDIFILDLEGRNLFSPDQKRVGEMNIIAEMKPNLIASARKGDTVFVPPISSHVALRGSRDVVSEISESTVVYFIAPVISKNARVIALLVQRLTSDKSFTQILRHGRIGVSGESYAIDSKGHLLSESRFRGQLIQIGLMKRNAHEAAEIEVRNPGIDLTKGKIAKLPRHKQPLTTMAEDVIRLGREGGHEHSPLIINTEGYRDYRGVFVFGAWMWNYNLGIGVTTEIDVKEATLAYSWLRIGLISTASVLMVLFIFAMLLTVVLAEKAIAAISKGRDQLEERVEERTKQLRVSESKYRTLYESSHDANITVDKERFVDCNRAALIMFGYTSKDELFKKHPMQLSPKYQPDGKDSISAAKEFFDKAVSDGACLVEWTHLRTNGEAFPAEVLLTSINLEGKGIFQLIIRDISERKELEKRQKQLLEAADGANRAKSNFLANMSHEIRTPMNAITGLSHLVLKTSLNLKQQDYVKKIQISAQSLLGIIDDILDFSKIEAGQLKIESIEFSLDDVLSNLATLAVTRIGDRPIEFIYNIDSSIPLRLKGDPFRLGQILTNLVANAIKFTNHGNIVLSVKKQEGKKPLTLLFEVVDNGIGISDEKLTDLFDPFTQADNSTTRRYGGTGLGLSICKHLISLLGGSIHVESELGKGSRFYFYLPFIEVEYSQLLAPNPDLRGMRVLLVDDNLTALDIMSDTLKSLSFMVDVACSGVEAINKLKESDNYDLILLDWRMPEMDGVETLKQIKANSLIQHSPIIMMTAYGREAVELDLAGLDFDGFLVKPLTPSQLFDAIIQAKRGLSVSNKHYASSESETSVPLLSGTVLLAEDNLINQQVAVEILENLGLKVNVCQNGIEAVEEVRNELPDLVLMDVQMPEMDGYQATKKIREELKLTQLPIYAMTANAMAGDEKKSMAAGMNGHITKPVDPEKLYELLRRVLPQSSKASVHDDKSSINKLDSDKTDNQGKKDFELPDSLPGLDLKRGIKQVGGNTTLYEKLLRDFVKNHGESVVMFKRCLDEKDIKSAHRTVHTLKGVAGNIGAKRLAETAAILEDALRLDQPVESSDLAFFSDACDELFNSLNTLFSEEHSYDKKTVVDSDKQYSLKDLITSLENGDFNSITIWDALSDDIKDGLSDEVATKVRQDIDDFEFDSAVEYLKGFVS